MNPSSISRRFVQKETNSANFMAYEMNCSPKLQQASLVPAHARELPMYLFEMVQFQVS